MFFNLLISSRCRFNSVVIVSKLFSFSEIFSIYSLCCDNIRSIDSRLRQLKKNESQPFGGINIMVFGDLFQLPPIRGAQVFLQPTRFIPAVHLWRLFSLVELTENMRQQGDTTFADRSLELSMTFFVRFTFRMSKYRVFEL